jgi:hypothetical protein
VRIGILVHEVHMYGGHTVCSLWLPTGTVVGDRRYDSGLFVYKVHTDCGVGQRLWRAGREGRC